VREGDAKSAMRRDKENNSSLGSGGVFPEGRGEGLQRGDREGRKKRGKGIAAKSFKSVEAWIVRIIEQKKKAAGGDTGNHREGGQEEIVANVHLNR